MDTSIRVTSETKKKLYRIKGQIESETGEHASLDKVVNELMKSSKKYHK